MNGFLDPAIAVPLMLIALIWAMRRQLRAERYDAWTYWTVVALVAIFGTAAGDMTAMTLHLGYFGSIVLFAALIAVPFVGYRRFGMNEVLAFWAAYVLTRPLGASVADWAAVDPHRGGLGLGAGGVSLILAAVVLLLIRRLAKTRMDVRVEEVGLDGSGVDRLARGRALGLDLG